MVLVNFLKEEKVPFKENKENQHQNKDTKEGNGKEIEELKSLAQDYKDMLQRLQAEFENFRKRNERENEDFRKFASAKLVAAFLPIVDSVRAGILLAEKSKNSEMKKGFEMVLKQIMLVLQSNGVEPIESVGKKFDHSFHEVLMTHNDPSKEDGVVLEELQRGYMLNGKVLRPSKVKVNKSE